jgi:23S rRNA pseudouridine2605 synthase
VGRLDTETTGLLLLTNDSELANRLTHPRYELPKTYEVTIRGRVEGETYEKLKEGLWLAEGRKEKPIVKIVRRTNVETIVQITVRQGLNRDIRFVFDRQGYKVMSIKRTAIGTLILKGVGVGHCKELTEPQILYLRRVTGLK